MATPKSNTIAIEVNSNEQQHQILFAFQDLLKDAGNHGKFLEFVHNYYSNTIKTPEFCPSLTHQGDFLHDLSSLYKQQDVMRETLQSLRKSFDKRLDCLDTCNKVSAVIFAAAAAVTAAVAAANAADAKMATVAAAGAAAAVLLLELRKWTHSFLKNRESAVKKHKEITCLVLIGVEIAIKDLKDIFALSGRLWFETGSMSENGGGCEELAAVRKTFQELTGKATDYNQNMKQTKLQVILRLL